MAPCLVKRQSFWVTRLSISYVGLLTLLSSGVHSKPQCLPLKPSGSENCPTFNCFANNGSSVHVPMKIPKESVLVCREQDHSSACSNILQSKSGTKTYSNSTFKGHLSLSEQGLDVTVSQWLEGKYQILTSLEEKCLTRVVLTVTDPVPVLQQAGGELAHGPAEKRNSGPPNWSLAVGSLVAACALLLIGLDN